MRQGLLILSLATLLAAHRAYREHLVLVRI
jgi:hypothetical protein